MTILWQKLQLLPKLSQLQLVDIDLEALTPPDIASISTLQSLQNLGVVLFASHCSAAAIAAAAPAGLTALSLKVKEPLAEAARVAVPEVCLARLRDLQSFSGEGVRMRPGTLASLTRLRDLRLIDPGIVSDSEEQGARELLAVLQHLTQLQHLQLSRCQLHSLEPQPQPQLEQQQQQGLDSLSCFSALTASTQLTALVLKQWNDAPVSQAAFDRIFPPGRVLPRLAILSLTTYSFQHCVEAAQIAKIAASCPALQELTLQGVTPRGFDVSCLQQLPQSVKRVEGVDWPGMASEDAEQLAE
jgi:hypothetical protein